MDVQIEVLLEILRHRADVQHRIKEICHELEVAAILHDKSKLDNPEFDAFTITRPKFRNANYGSKEYQECVEQIQPAIDHHYAHNRHHTECHPSGFADMDLIDILEMLADWRAANARSRDLLFRESVDIAFEKYNIPENMRVHILRTLKRLGWI